MPKEIILKKIEQIKALLAELERLLAQPITEFKQDLTAIRAAERNFQLMVELASDINATILIDAGQSTPDSYRQSFADLQKLGVIADELSLVLVTSAKLRNILVHEYDFEEDYERFYVSAKQMMPSYQEYIEAILKYIR
jgi:uncharacterized protein YutE (UPF0331/DUF86 family)